MPLISSPIDGQPMRQITRYGIEFDVCPSTGGIWLDKGELEKLIALVREEVQAEVPPARDFTRDPGRDMGRDRGRERPHYRDDDDDDDKYRGYGKRKSRLSDLFDF